MLRKVAPALFRVIARDCPEGYVFGKDRRCHPECGNSGTYCIGGSICYYGQCLSCDPGYYLATDGRCYPY